MIRVSSTVVAMVGASKPGVMIGHDGRRQHEHDVARTASAMSIRFATVETTRHARAVPSVASRPDTTGIRADERAPAATSWKIRSGIRKAA